MSLRFESARGNDLSEALVSLAIHEHTSRVLPRLERLWTYYRNPLEPVGHAAFMPMGADAWSRPGRWYRLAQEVGLPPRVSGTGAFASNFALPAGVRSGDDRSRNRREVVVENDITWRIHSMVDFMFGKPPTLVSTARDEAQREHFTRILDAVWENSGGIAMLQDAALLAHVYGWVDLLVRVDPDITSAAGDDPRAIARRIRIEVVEPTRGIAIQNPADYRELDGYIVHFSREVNEVSTDKNSRPVRRTTTITETISRGRRVIRENDSVLTDEPLGFSESTTGVVHIQNLTQPFRYEGLSEVEPLIPLQDELNTRLSDRASRVTLQCFKMYLAKGIEGFDQNPVGPGQIWTTDNPDAEIESFGGDANAPSEEQHILEIREAMDKISGVPPLASGVVRAKIGNLSSANALRITLMGVLSKTARKRVTYGRGIAQVCRLILDALDTAGVVASDPNDRGVRIEWPDPVPTDVREQALAAEAKVRLGVPGERVLSELGYSPADPGIQ